MWLVAASIIVLPLNSRVNDLAPATMMTTTTTTAFRHWSLWQTQNAATKEETIVVILYIGGLCKHHTRIASYIKKNHDHRVRFDFYGYARFYMVYTRYIYMYVCVYVGQTHQQHICGAKSAIIETREGLEYSLFPITGLFRIMNKEKPAATTDQP